MKLIAITLVASLISATTAMLCIGSILDKGAFAFAMMLALAVAGAILAYQGVKYLWVAYIGVLLGMEAACFLVAGDSIDPFFYAMVEVFIPLYSIAFPLGMAAGAGVQYLRRPTAPSP